MVTPVSTVCPGCGAVLAPVPDAPARPGASPSCTRLFEVTVHGLREEVDAEPAASSAVRLADATYDVQHPDPDDPERLTGALAVLTALLPGAADTTPDPGPVRRPVAWQMTVADVAADLDVVDLPALIETWAASTLADWHRTNPGSDTQRC